MAMHEVHPWVIRLKAQGYEGTGVDQDGIATEWIGMRRRQVPARVVSVPHIVARNDLKRSAVKMPGVAAGLKSGDDV